MCERKTSDVNVFTPCLTHTSCVNFAYQSLTKESDAIVLGSVVKGLERKRFGEVREVEERGGGGAWCLISVCRRRGGR